MAIMFVYGTLRTGYGNWNRLISDAQSFGRAVTRGTYDLLDGAFPRMIPGRTGRIVGELFLCGRDHVERCDRLEGHPKWYVRRRIWVRRDDTGAHLRVYAYVMSRRVASTPEGRLIAPLIPHDGDGLCEWDPKREGAVYGKKKEAA